MFLFNILSSNNLLFTLINIVAYLSVLFIVMPAHEFAHAYTAKREGDYTAYYSRRCTLAPFAHIDGRGFLFLLLFGFGWAKPVPIDSRNFKNGRKSEVKVAIAGVLTNILQGFIFCGLYVALHVFVPISIGEELWYMYFVFLRYGTIISFSLALFNLLPVYPLDGFRTIEALAKPGNAYVDFMHRHASTMFFVLYLFVFLCFDYILNPVLNGVVWLWDNFFGLFV